MDRDKVIAILKALSSDYTRLGVKSLALFGSVARDEARPDSDVDVLVEFFEAPTFAQYMDLKFLLEDALGNQVDLVSRKTLKPQLQSNVEREAISIA